MVSALDKKLVRDFRHLKGQIATIAVVVACGIAVFVTMKSTWHSLHASRDAYYDRYRYADVFATLKRAPDSVTAEIDGISGVSVAYTRVVHGITLPMEGMSSPATARVVSLPESGVAPLNGLYLRTGRRPVPGRADEAVVVESFAQAHGLKPGDTIPAVMAGKLRQLQIVGIGMSPEFVFVFGGGFDAAPDDRRTAVLWMDRGTMAPAFQMDGAFNDVAVRLEPGASVEDVKDELDRILEPYGSVGAVGADKQPSNFFIEGELTQLEQSSTVVPLIFLAVAAFLLNIVLSRLVYLQRPQIAALKALGYANRQIALHYFKFVALIVVLGAVLGVLLGAWLGNEFTALYARYFRFPVLTFEMEFGTVAVSVLISLGAALAGAALSVYSITSLSPADAMRPPAPASYRSGWFDRVLLPSLLGVSAMMVVREILRRPMRVLVSSLGIACAVGIMVVGRFGYDSFEHLIHVVYHEEQRGDMTVAFYEPQAETVEHELEQIPGVLDAEGIRMVPVRFRNGPRRRDAAIVAVPRHSRLRHVLDRRARRVALPAEGIALSSKLAEVLGVGLGEVLTVDVREGNRPTLKVGVTQLVDDAFGLMGYMSQDALHQLLGQQRAVSIVQLRVDGARLPEIHRRLKQQPGLASVTEKSWVIKRFEEHAGEMQGVMTLILSIFGAAIAVGVVYNNARISLSVRSRDLASLRILGFSRREISAVLLGELATQMILGVPLGLLFGRWWASALMSTVDPETYRLSIIISNSSYAFAAAVALIAGLVSAFLVRRKLDKLDLIAVLKTRE